MSETNETEGNDCRYCGLPSPSGEFCSRPCRDRGEERELPSIYDETSYQTGVDAIDLVLPSGIPSDAFTFVSHESGSCAEGIFTELAWNALDRGHDVVMLTAVDTPETALTHFARFGRNPIPHLTDGSLKLIDCFTASKDPGTRQLMGTSSTASEWGEYIQTVAETGDSVYSVSDPTPNTIGRRLDDTVSEDCIVLVDSITTLQSELGTATTYDLLTRLRAEVCKKRRTPIFAGASYESGLEEFPHDLEHLVDGVIDLQLNPNHTSGELVMELLVRKMRGVPVSREFVQYDIVPGHGVVSLSDREETE